MWHIHLIKEFIGINTNLFIITVNSYVRYRYILLFFKPKKHETVFGWDISVTKISNVKKSMNRLFKSLVSNNLNKLNKKKR